MTYATCRGCDRAFTKDGPGAQSVNAPRLCLDCHAREVAFHPHHSPGTKCIAELAA